MLQLVGVRMIPSIKTYDIFSGMPLIGMSVAVGRCRSLSVAVGRCRSLSVVLSVGQRSVRVMIGLAGVLSVTMVGYSPLSTIPFPGRSASPDSQ